MTSSQQPLAPLRILRLVASANADSSESLKLSQQILFALASQAGRRAIQLARLAAGFLLPDLSIEISTLPGALEFQGVELFVARAGDGIRQRRNGELPWAFPIRGRLS